MPTSIDEKSPLSRISVAERATAAIPTQARLPPRLIRLAPVAGDLVE